MQLIYYLLIKFYSNHLFNVYANGTHRYVIVHSFKEKLEKKNLNHVKNNHC